MSKKKLIPLVLTSVLAGCNTVPHTESFCFLYTPVVFSTIEAKTAIVVNNDNAEFALLVNKGIYKERCK